MSRPRLEERRSALELAGQAHVELMGARNVKSALERAVAAGNGKKHFPVLVKTL